MTDDLLRPAQMKVMRGFVRCCLESLSTRFVVSTNHEINRTIRIQPAPGGARCRLADNPIYVLDLAFVVPFAC